MPACCPIEALTVNGKSLWENCKDAPIYSDEVIRPLDKPLIADGGICIPARQPRARAVPCSTLGRHAELMKHRGRAVVFENFEDYKAASTTRRSTWTPAPSS